MQVSKSQSALWQIVDLSVETRQRKQDRRCQIPGGDTIRDIAYPEDIRYPDTEYPRKRGYRKVGESDFL